MFILTPGSDPTELINGLAKKKKKEVLSVSMGQGQEIVARRYMDSSIVTGGWVLLQNTHLGIKFLTELEQSMLKYEHVDPEFRVWITAQSQPEIPIGLLQMAIKVNLGPQPLTLNPLPSTLNPQPLTPHPKPQTPHTKPRILHPTPQPPNPTEPQSTNPKPQTTNPTT